MACRLFGANDGPVYWRIYASLGLNELNLKEVESTGQITTQKVTLTTVWSRDIYSNFLCV